MKRFYLLLSVLFILVGCDPRKGIIAKGIRDIGDQDVLVVKESYNFNKEVAYTDSIYFRPTQPEFTEFTAWSGFGRSSYDGGKFIEQTNWDGEVSEVLYKSSRIELNYLRDFRGYRKKIREVVSDDEVWDYKYRFMRTNAPVYMHINLDTAGRVSRIMERHHDDKLFWIDDSVVYSFRYPTEPLDSSHFESSKVFSYTEEIQTLSDTAFQDLRVVDGYKRLSGHSAAKEGNVVLIHSFIGCAPCLRLKNDLKELVNTGEIDSTRIVVMNSTDPRSVLEKYISDKHLPFVYYSANGLRTRHGNPWIIAYRDGKYVWDSVGYSNGQVKRIVKFLTEN